ncbi:hypothetical protein KVR01_003411 [Diaporthe batatas]|uniref:uncharacterized protein n=1 Tax=Diaporthe batatas TaxID=748121 RepID=UPI001D05B6B4|nr:uncharacterized protein KVR01_003411 [Diaporthe batatas]KAG8167722.1 hypothetical protein KVR01_003411 [Diaporthe batatas]
MAPPRPPTFDKMPHQSTSTMSNLQTVDGKMPQISTRQFSPNDNDHPSTNITALANELLVTIARYLAVDTVEAHLDDESFQGYIQCQKDLRNLCLVSKQMQAVARQYLYRAVIVRNSDVLVYLARTLDESPDLGPLVKQLVFEVPFDLKDVRYRKPYVGVLGSRQNYARICRSAVEALDVAKYEEFRLHSLEFIGRETDVTFREWGWGQECEILRELHVDILQRLPNVELLYFGRLIPTFETRFTLDYCSFVLKKIARPFDGQGLVSQPVSGPQSKLKQLHLLGANPDGEVPSLCLYLWEFVQIPSLQVLKCNGDDGDVYPISIDPPFGVSQLAQVSVKRGTPAKHWGERDIQGFGTKEFLSTELDKLEHLRELSLDLHYRQNIKPLLGEHGVLSLGSLDKLTHVRLPLHCLVEVQTGSELRLADLSVVLPPSVKHLAVWADLDSVGSWDKGPSTGMFSSGPPPTPGVSYHPSESALEFMESVCSLLTSHFKHLEDATYCFAGKALDMPCECDGDTLCSRCEALQLLDVRAIEDSATRMGILASESEARGVRLRTLQEPIEE